MFVDKQIKCPLVTFILTELVVIILEWKCRVPLNEIDWLRFAFIRITDALRPLVPTTGPFAEAGSQAIFITYVVILFLYILPGLCTAFVVYMLVRDEK